MSESVWILYLIRCADGSLYTGITTDVERRLREHRDENGAGLGAKFLRGKQPLTLVYQTILPNRSEALRLEYRVKQLSKTDKEALVANKLSLPALLNTQTVESI